jgi:hypothetical protein
VEGRGLWEEETEKGKLGILAGRTAERWTHGVGDGVDALDSLVKGTLGADVLDEDVRERLALKLLLDVLALKSQPQNSQKVEGVVSRRRSLSMVRPTSAVPLQHIPSSRTGRCRRP